jgi:hypothetical protein
MLKTMVQWDGSGKGLTEFLEIGDTVDSDLLDYVIGVLPPATMNGKVVQMGEPYNHDNHGRGMYLTVEKKAGKWTYTGIKTRGEVK